MKISVNTSNNFCNKKNLTDNKSAYLYLDQKQLEPLELVELIIAGKAYSIHYFSSNRRVSSEWVSSQLLALDLDDCPLSASKIAEIPEIKKYAFLVYATPSSTPEKPKTRILFLMPDAVTRGGYWKTLQIALINHFADLKPDPACKDLARMFFGSTQSEHYLLGNIAPWWWLGGLCAPAAVSDYQKTLIKQQEQRKPVKGNRAEKYAKAAYNQQIDKLANAKPGERNVTLFKVAAQLQSMVLGGWPGIDSATVRSDIQSIYSGWENTAKSEKTMENGFKAAQAKPLELPEKRPKRSVQHRESVDLPQPAKLIPFTADRTFNTRYVNQAPKVILDGDCIALKTPTNGGKSTWAAETTQNAPTLITISYRRSLVKAQAKQYGALMYDDLDGGDQDLLLSAERISTTIDSLHKFAGLPFHTVVIDEWNSLLDHLASAGTLRKKAAIALETLKDLILNATRVIVMDAHLNNASVTLLKALRGDVIFVENTYVHEKVPTQMLPYGIAFFTTIIERVSQATLPVLIGITSPAEARVVKDLITETHPEKRVKVVTIKQSHLFETQEFILNINTELKYYDVLIFNSAMSTGVNITAEVDSIICLISNPLSPTDAVQMLGRARNTQKRFASVPLTVGDAPQDASEIYYDLELATKLNRIEATIPIRQLGRLHAQCTARRNTDMAEYLPKFMAYCIADGSTPESITIKLDKHLEKWVKETRKRHRAKQEADVLNIKGIDTITPDMLAEIRLEGLREITPEIDAGVLRYKIEFATAQQVTAPLYMRYHTKKAREALSRADAWTSEKARTIDLGEDQENIPLHQRINASSGKVLLKEGLQHLGAQSLSELPEVINGVREEYFDEFKAWAFLTEAKFRALLGYRQKHNGDLEDGAKAVRFFLKKFGVTLEKKQKMVNGERFQVYYVNAAEIDALEAIIELRRKIPEKVRIEQITTKWQNTSILPIRSKNKSSTQFDMPTDERTQPEMGVIQPIPNKRGLQRPVMPALMATG